ncbi:MAG: IS110 family transposase [Bacilli bacterium]|nr:IS110 family transposase [Bacilli bacterium]
MENPIIACDVSKGKSHIQGFIGLSNPVGNPFVVRHIKSELKLIKELAKSLEKQTKNKPVFVFEFTGIYHEPIVAYIRDIGLDSYAISPLESAKVRKSSIRVTKTDSKDCLNIATVYYTRHIRKYENENNDIKSLSREKASIRRQLIQQKCVYHRYIDLIWPCFDQYFDVDTQIGSIVISTYKHPYVIKRRSVNMVAEILLNNGHYSKNRAYDFAYKLKEYATECVSGVDEKSRYVVALNNTFNRIKNLNDDMNIITNNLENILRKQTAYPILKTIPGFGENITLQVAAEIGNYTRFETAKQFVAYCGLDPSILQSGSNNGEHYSITRKGNCLLRSSFYLAVSQMLTQKLDNQITRFYFKKKSSGLSHKVAAVASCRKLACCVFGMLKNGTCFETI